ncbi:hypothetical protein FACS1894163_01730 [Spirochaetia bacterium]|nr:hypothetical protein FACS1894163_01730 [Spirochaetia bacterium]
MNRKSVFSKAALAAMMALCLVFTACAPDVGDTSTDDGGNPGVGETANDITAPVLSADSVSDLSTTAGNTATLKFTSDEAGTYYYMVLASGAYAPGAATVKAQGPATAKGRAAATAAINTIYVTGLTPASTYTAYIVVEDAALNLSTLLTITDVNPSILTGPDTTAPELSAGSVSNLDTSAGTTAALNFTSNEAGTYYYVVLASGASAPNATTVKAQGTAVAKGTAAATAGINTIVVTGLTPGSTYKAYIVVEDAALNPSTLLTITDVNPVISTDPDTTAPVLSAGSVSNLDTSAGDTATLKFTSNEAGTSYYVVLASGDSAPDAANVKTFAAMVHWTEEATAGINTIYVTGLTPNSTYTAYVVVEDAAFNLSTVLPIPGVNPIIPTGPDTTAPELSAGSVSNLPTPAGTTATLKFTSSEAGTYYYMVLGSGASRLGPITVKAQGTAVPGVPAVAAEAKGTAPATVATNTITVTGLTPGSTYTAYIVVEDAALNLSAVLTITGVNPVIYPDITAPVVGPGGASLINADNLSSSTGTTATLRFTSNEAGTYYYVVLASGVSAPNAAAVKAQSLAAAAKGTGTAAATLAGNTINVTDLTPNSTYRAYIVVEDAAGNLSNLYGIFDVNPVKNSVTGNITLSFDDKGNGAFSQEDFELHRPFRETKTINLTGSWDGQTWYVDAKEVGTGKSLILDAREYTRGIHTLSVTVRKGSGAAAVYWSKELKFKVIDY